MCSARHRCARPPPSRVITTELHDKTSSFPCLWLSPLESQPSSWPTGVHKGGRALICRAAGTGGPASHPIKPDDAEITGIPPSSAVPGEASATGADSSQPASLEDAATEEASVSASGDTAEARDSQQEASPVDQLVTSVQVP